MCGVVNKMRSKRLKIIGLWCASLGLAVLSARGVGAVLGYQRLGQVLGDSTLLAQAPTTGTSFLPTNSTSGSAILSPLFQVNIPAVFADAVTLASLVVEEQSVFNGQARFVDEVVLENGAQLLGNLNAEGIDIDVGTGEITASNLVYSVIAGGGIEVSGDQDLTITNTDRGSAQKIFGKIKVGSDTAEAGSNTDTFEFASGDGISLSLNTSDKKLTVTAANQSGWYKASSSNVVLLSSTDNVGIGTSAPTNELEIDSGTDGASGVSFTRITSSTAAGIGGGKVLSVDSGGKIILVQDQTGDTATPSAEAVLPTATNGMTLYFNGLNWAASNNLFHDGGSVGISTATPVSRFHVYTNLATKIGQIIQGYTGQTANLTEWRDSSGSVLSYIDASGVFNGAANVSGSLNPGLTNGSVLFQGTSGITQDNTNFFWDDTNNRLGIGTSAPSVPLDVRQTAVTTLANFVSANDSLNWLGTRFGASLANGTSAYGLSIGFYNSGGNKLIGFTYDGTPSAVSFRGSTNDVWQFDSRVLMNGGLIGAYHSDLNITLNQHTVGAGEKGIRFKTNGGSTTAMSVMETGRVGVGTTAPNSFFHISGGYDAFDAFTVNQTLSGNILSASASGATKMVLTNAGNLGIGTTNPAYKLDVSAVTQYVARFVGASGVSPQRSMISIGNNQAGGAAVLYSGPTYTWKMGVDANNDFLLNIGNDINDANPTLTGFLVDRATGNFGIGTTDPGQKLEVKNGNIQVNSDTNVSGNFYLYKNGALVSRFGTDATNSIAQISTYGTTDLFFTPATGRDVVFYGGGVTEIMRVDTSTNNVGIGTTTQTATAKLHVNGGYGANDALTVNQTLSGNILSASASGATKFVISNGGRVGIGTAIPGAMLQVIPPNQTDFSFQVSSDDGVGIIKSQWRNTAIGYGAVPVSTTALLVNSAGTEASEIVRITTSKTTAKLLVLRPPASNTANMQEWQDSNSNVLSAVNASGYLGIGTSSPAVKLHVYGPTDGTGSELVRFDSSGHNDNNAIVKVLAGGTTGRAELYLRGGTTSAGYSSLFLGDSGDEDVGGITYSHGENSLRLTVNAGEKVRIDSSGYVGIGTTVPGQLLHVESNQNAPTIALVKNTTSGTNGRAGISAETASSKVISMQAVSSGMTTVPGWANTGVVYTDTAALQLVSGDIAGYMTFTTGNAQTSGYERMRISSGGQISIGTTTATALLHVNGGYGANDAFTVNQTLGGNILSASASGATKLVLTNGGNLGIGTTSPSSLLTVHGDIRVSGTSAGIYAGQEGDLYLQGAGANIFHNGQNWIQPYYNSSYNTAFFTPFGPTDPRMVIASSGNVGVGTTNPTSKLHVSSAISSSSTVPGISFSGYSTDTLNTGVLMNLQHTTAGDKGMSALLLIDNQNTAEVSDAGLKISSVTPGASSFGIQIGIDVSDSDIQDYAMEIGANSIHGTSLLLDGNGASYLNGGNLGIGTTNPGTSLDIYTSSTSRLMLSSSTFDLISSNSSATPFEINHLGGAALIVDIQDGSTSVFAIADGGNVGIGTTTFGTSAAKALAIAGSTAPSTSITDGVQLFAVDVTGSHELQVRDEAGNVTTLSPHNFSQIETGKSEDLAWSFYSERGGLAINADMTKALRLVEKLSGEKLVYIKNLTNGADLSEFYAEEAEANLQVAQFVTQSELSPLVKWTDNTWTFLSQVVFEKPAEFLAEVSFRGRVYFSDKDAAGQIIMKPGDTMAEVPFEHAFVVAPAVTLTTQNSYVRATLTEVSPTGFKVTIESPQPTELKITWTALAVTGLRTTQGQAAPSAAVTTPAASTEPSPTATPTTSSSPTGSAAPSPSPEVAGASTSATLSPTPAPSPTE